MWPRIVAGIFIPVGNHCFQALASTLQFVAQVCDRLWLVPATDRAFAYITYMSPPHVALVCSGPPQCAATCGWTKWPVCSGPLMSVTHSPLLFVTSPSFPFPVQFPPPNATSHRHFLHCWTTETIVFIFCPRCWGYFFCLPITYASLCFVLICLYISLLWEQ